MKFFVIVRRLKRNLRRRIKRRLLTFGVLLLVVAAAVIHFAEDDNDNIPTFYSPEQYDVYLKRAYLCGEETVFAGSMSLDEVEQLQRDHAEWKREEEGLERIVFVEEIDELSNHCGENAYFGLTPDGHLSLFNGLPENKEIIRTFFQLNIGFLESSLPQETVRQLYKGIRVTDREEYNSVLSTFSPYAIEVPEDTVSTGVAGDG